MSFRFEKLQVWQESRVLIVDIYKLTLHFPKNEIFALTNQIKRAVVSIALNIAEGSDKKSDKEFVKFLRISLGSLEEVVTAMYVALDLKYLNEKDFNLVYNKLNLLASKINALINSIKKL
ncbi:MAG TPA: four helix bundle protein [Patescibacteria group bacterium]|nr:four helix bundle protein [Patescibacteria group bacterium]